MLAVKQIAAKLGVSQAIVYGWCASKKLAHIRVGRIGRRGLIRVSEVDLEKFLQTLTIVPIMPIIETAEREKPKQLKLKHLNLN